MMDNELTSVLGWGIYLKQEGDEPMTMRRRERRPHRISVWFAILCSVAFFGAINYCNLEAFAAHLPQTHELDHAVTAEHHDEESSMPAHHHDENSVACCSAIQAIAASRVDFHLASTAVGQLHPLVLQSSWLASLLEPSHTASGLSPPAREPTPARPFYRTTFANHAPPVSLA